MSIYVVAIGGTGAKIAQSIAHLASLGVYGNTSLKILLVDPDKGNGNLEEADKTIKAYKNCANLFVNNGIKDDQLNWWMQTELNQFSGGVWSPFIDTNVRLRDIFGYDNYHEDNNLTIRHLLDVLYTPQQRDLNLSEGFRGIPAIGSAIMAVPSVRNVNNYNEEIWQQLIDRVVEDYNHAPGNPPTIFLCGSIFGGTGASGFPTLARLIHNKLTEHPEIKLGGVLMLPYFQFNSNGKNLSEDEIFAKSEEFILKSEAALRYYALKKFELDSVYLLGIPSYSRLGEFSPGGRSQRNQSHYLELLAGLALQDFVQRAKPARQTVVLLNREKQDRLGWNDIPNREEIRKKITIGTQFAFLWRSRIVDLLDHSKDKPSNVRWALKFYRDAVHIRQTEEWDNIGMINNWCQNYLEWLGTIHQQGSNLNWFNLDVFCEQGRLKNQLDYQRFPDLVRDIPNRYTVNQIEERLVPANRQERPGTVGVAKALYQILWQA